ncbi:MAG: enolase C-terminal domain-like protein [Candidatus Binatia bacterium]
MKIVDFKATPVALPMEAPLRHSAAVHPGRCIRTILQLYTDEGIVGIGELEDVVHEGQLNILRPILYGRDPFDIEQLRILIIGTGHLLLQGQHLARNRLYAGIEIALMDIQAKILGRPLHQLLGGKLREEIPMSAYLFYRYESKEYPAVSTPEDMVAHARDLVTRYGFRTLKVKGGVFEPDHEIATMQQLRAAFGPKYQLRLDPNNVWALGTAIRAGHRLREVDLEYLEDPTWGIDGMAEVAHRTGIPLATNMCVVTFEQIPPAVAKRAVDVMLADPWYWGGPWGVKHLAVICQTFKIGLGMHSGLETGIGLAAMLHTAAALPNLIYAVDAHYHHLTDDLIVGGKMEYRDGALRVPDGPGLGVEIDEERLKDAARRYELEGGLSFPLDPKRPEWYQKFPMW